MMQFERKRLFIIINNNLKERNLIYSNLRGFGIVGVGYNVIDVIVVENGIYREQNYIFLIK